MRNRVWDDEGQQFVFMAFILVILLVFVGLVIDAGNLYFHRRTAQNTADAAAMAGSVRLASSQTSARITALDYAASNGYDNDGQSNTVTVTFPNGCIRVQVDENVHPLLASLIWNGTIPVGARATGCKMTAPIRASVIVLDPSGADALQLSGTSTLQVTRGNVHVNSSSSTAVSVGGTASLITQTPTTIVGGRAPGGTIRPEPITGAAVREDPLQYLPDPSTAACKSPQVLKSGTAKPGCYKSISMSGQDKLNLSQGVYILGSGISKSSDAIATSGNAEVTGSGVMFYILTGNVNVGGKKFAVTPPDSGDYEGVLFFSERSAQSTYTFGSNVEGIRGIIYTKSGTIDLTGGPQVDVNFAVGRFRLGGNAVLTVYGYDSANWMATEYRMVE